MAAPRPPTPTHRAPSGSPATATIFAAVGLLVVVQMRSLDLGSFVRHRSPFAELFEPAKAAAAAGGDDVDAEAIFWFGGGERTDDEAAIEASPESPSSDRGDGSEADDDEADDEDDDDDDDEDGPSSASAPMSDERGTDERGILSRSASVDDGRATGSRTGRDGGSMARTAESRPRRNATRSGPISPACRPHFRAAPALNSTRFDSTKFQRLYLYHARKAGGTSLANYLVKVAHHYGIEFQQDEWKEAEAPGSNPVPTLYVAHLREPVDRSISHFKYSGRWNCKLLIHPDTFTPTEANAKKIETWNQTSGHVPTRCNKKGIPLRPSLFLGDCAVNCYTQWFAGSEMACPVYQKTAAEQYRAARRRLMSYNAIIILEWLKDPDYAAAVERYFGVPGATKRRGAFCERASHKANDAVPLRITDATRRRLFDLNELDRRLYDEITDCRDGEGARTYDFPLWDETRVHSVKPRVPHFKFDIWRKENKKKKRMGLDENNATKVSEDAR